VSRKAATALTPSSGRRRCRRLSRLRRVTWTGSPRVELQYVHPSYLQAAYPSTPSARPRVFSIEGSTLKIAPWMGQRSNSTTSRKFRPCPSVVATKLVARRASRSLSLRRPGRGGDVRRHDERAPLWKARRDEIFDEIEKLSNKTRGAGAMRVMGVTP